MSKVSAPAHDTDPLLATRTRPRLEGVRSSRAADLRDETPRAETPRDVTPAARADSDIDAEMLDFVRSFEEKYAELAPSSDAVQYDVNPDDDLFPEFPERFDELPIGRTLTGGATRVLPLARREPELAQPVGQRARQPETAGRADTAVDLDEAILLLRAGEVKRAEAAAARARDRELAGASTEPVETARTMRQRDGVAASAEMRSRPLGTSPTSMDWTTKSHRLQSIAVACAVFALVVGVVGGYLIGRSPDQKASRAKIEVTQQGGMKLRFDSQLPQR